MSSPKLKDVAQRAGVSISTASCVLNGKGNISKEVRERIYKAAKHLGYRKNLYASYMAQRKSYHIAILIHEDYEKAFEWNFIRHMIIQLESVITKEGYYPVMIPVNLGLKTVQVLEKILASGAGAIFSIHYGNQELFTQLEDQNIPVIVINNSNFQDKFHSVCVDDFQGAYEGALYLIRLNHRKIAYIEYNRPEVPSVLADRFIGFKKALDEQNLEFPHDYKITINLYDRDELHNKLQALFSGTNKPTALFAHDDYLAARVIVEIVNLKLKVPEDLSIIAPGDTLDYNQPYIPKITTLSINTDLLGKIAGELMITRLKHNPDDIQVLKIKQQLIERGSCKKLN